MLLNHTSDLLWNTGSRWKCFLLMVIAAWLMTTSSGFVIRYAHAQMETKRTAVLVFYYHSDQNTDLQLFHSLNKIIRSRKATTLQAVDLDNADQKQLLQYQRFLDYFSITADSTPLLIGCNAYRSRGLNEQNVESYVEQMLRVDIYTRAGCSHCEDAIRYLNLLRDKYPGFEFRVRDIFQDAEARQDLIALTQRYKQAAASTPVFHLCNQMIVGFQGIEITGNRLEKLLTTWTMNSGQTQSKMEPSLEHQIFSEIPFPAQLRWERSLFTVPVGLDSPESSTSLLQDETSLDPPSFFEPDLNDASPLGPESDTTIILPWIGEVNADHLGMPLFTILVGLVDGFNPCAMWVLLFLLSLLVNLKDRLKILLIAATFVLVSGLAYFAFMAAWLNVFLLIGYLRSVQVILAILAIGIGSIHIKDFFLFKKGISLSVPESAKPGIYARTRQIITAENLYGALFGAFVLAVLVNIVELLCTAGLPALYTQILTEQNYSTWTNYGYLLLYNIAYMFDDSIMVAIVVITLGKNKLQERQGRWLKLMSGVVILVLGLVMLIRPEWLS